VDEAADAVQVFRRWTPCGLHFMRTAGEAAVARIMELKHRLAGCLGRQNRLC
jgi:hypothetical protein